MGRVYASNWSAVELKYEASLNVKFLIQCKKEKHEIYLVVVIIFPTQRNCWGGILVSLHPSVCSSRIPCPLCSAHSSGWIHFIFVHLIKQLQKVCRVYSCMENFKIWIFGKFFKFVTLTVFFWLGIWCESLVWVIMGQQGVSQNAGILVVLV